jgi:hypothetical protein
VAAIVASRVHKASKRLDDFRTPSRLRSQVMEKRRLVKTQTFVVRIVDGGDHPGPGTWRASIVEIASGDRTTIATYAELAAFIEEHRRRAAASSK